jgi:hypothetical protein
MSAITALYTYVPVSVLNASERAEPPVRGFC